ncbi:F0F1 ATP synthase subunit B family protein [Kitasatospora griseola]|uniref:ATP synthase subunit b n=1 Tax=Kitasatospora griseola TaxID=2064 RepID=A0A0D0Q5H1_KITGR|nr:ATP synthase F0 subunit B [Kitasatospora griseola]KIQ66303.1 ATP synthase F0 subunit B [Kitasatospora griseola]GGQ89010.1 ATP synthase subunit b [Kitasatospora griseola]
MGPLEPNVPELILGLIVFFLLFAVLGKVVLPRIERTLAERHDKTDGGLVRAEAARAEAERIRDEFQAELSAARHEAAAIRQTAAEEGAALVAALRAEGLQQRERLVAEAQVQLAADKVLAEAELREDVIKVATELASRVVGEPLADLSSTRAIAEEYRNRATV